MKDLLSLSDGELHDPAVLVKYSRAELLGAARGFVPATGRAIGRMDKAALAKSISAQAKRVKAWSDGHRDKFPKSSPSP